MYSVVDTFLTTIGMIWLSFIILAWSYFLRFEAKGEAKLISLAFAILTFIFPPFAIVPMLLNIRPFISSDE